MNQDQKTPQPDPATLHPMVVLQPGERVICEIKRHPFGIITMYVASFFALLVVTAVAVLAPSVFGQYISSTSNIQTLVAVGAVVFAFLIIAVLFVATRVYWQNRWIVTDDSITQITQDSLFGRRVSQLSMENLEDITIDQHGLIQTMFDFGTLRAETAGERSKFAFQYCPNPKKFARSILEVHENFIHQMRHQPQPVNPVMPINGPSYEQQMQYQGQPQQYQPQPMQQQDYGQYRQPQQQAYPQYQDNQYQQPAAQYQSPEPVQSQQYQPMPQPFQQSENQAPQPQQWGAPVPPPPYMPPSQQGQPSPDQQFQNGSGEFEQQRNSTLPPPLQ